MQFFISFTIYIQLIWIDVGVDMVLLGLEQSRHLFEQNNAFHYWFHLVTPIHLIVFKHPSSIFVILIWKRYKYQQKIFSNKMHKQILKQ